jgi:hypothetical protein
VSTKSWELHIDPKPPLGGVRFTEIKRAKSQFVCRLQLLFSLGAQALWSVEVAHE